MGRTNRDRFYFNWVLSTWRLSHRLYSLTLWSFQYLLLATASPTLMAMICLNYWETFKVCVHVWEGVLFMVGALRAYRVHTEVRRPPTALVLSLLPQPDTGPLLFAAAPARLAGPESLRILMFLPSISAQECCNWRCSLTCLAFHGFLWVQDSRLHISVTRHLLTAPLFQPCEYILYQWTPQHICSSPQRVRATTDGSPSHQRLIPYHIKVICQENCLL